MSLFKDNDENGYEKSDTSGTGSKYINAFLVYQAHTVKSHKVIYIYIISLMQTTAKAD